MNRGFWVDVFEDDISIVFKDDAAWNCSGNDFFKNGHVGILSLERPEVAVALFDCPRKKHDQQAEENNCAKANSQ